MKHDAQSPSQALVCAPLVCALDPLEATRILNQELGGLNGGGHVLPVPETSGDTRWERTITYLAGLPVDRTPHGWRLTGVRSRAGLAARRASRGLSDLVQRSADDAEDAPMGARSVAVVGLATLARRLALPGGEPLASDRGACEDVAQAWAEGMSHLAKRLSGLPGASAVIRVEEPELETALAGDWTSSSGYRRLAPFEEPWWRSHVEAMVETVQRQAAGAQVWVPARTGSAQLVRAADAHQLKTWPHDEQQAEFCIEILESLTVAGSAQDRTNPTVVMPVPRAQLAAERNHPTLTARSLMEPLIDAGIDPRRFTEMVVDHCVGRGQLADQLTVGRIVSRLLALSQALHDVALG